MTNFQKPTIALRKYDETEFVNVRTYWSLMHNANHDAPLSYELRVRYNAVDNARTFVAWDMGDTIELVTKVEYMERRQAIVDHEGNGECMACRNPEGASYRVELSIGDVANNPRIGPHTRVNLCDRCRGNFPHREAEVLTSADSRNRADALLADKVRVMEGHEERILAHLTATWEAFALLFRPEYNCF